MGVSSIESEFKFISYKIHQASLQMSEPYINRLLNLKPDGVWQIKFGIPIPEYHSKEKVYMGGIHCGMFLFDKDLRQEEQVPEHAVVSVHMAIKGIFQVESERFDKAIEDRLVRVQIPALLFPYIRGAMTSLLANAGFGSVIIPLINMNEVGKDALKDKDIKIIE
jgi:preprotein translocase subunit SecB